MPTRALFTVFISYASQDRVAAQRLAEALERADIQVWFDVNELRGGDAWDDMIHQRIRNCTFFIPLISATTRARMEGYFRREWKLAVERSLDMADDRTFILPVAIDDTPQETARVPRKFLELQWTRLPEGLAAEPLVERIQALYRHLAAGAPGIHAVATSNPPLPLPAPRRGATMTPARWLFAVAALVLAGAGGWRWLETRTPAIDEHSVAVLPFANYGGNPDDEYFSDGLSEELMACLARDNALHIAARTSSFAFKGRNLPVQEIGAQLRVATLIEGSIQRDGDELKIIVRLIKAADGYRLWSETYARKRTDIFALETELANDIATKLFPAVGRPAPSVRPTTQNLDAYDAYLRGRSFQLKPPTRENLEQSAQFFRAATTLDPKYAIAWARYGTALSRLHTEGFDDSADNLQQARHAIEQALAIEPNLPEAHSALAGYYTMHWTNQRMAEKELLLAHQGLPNDPDILADLAACCLNLGRKTEAIDYVRRAAALDPQNGDIANFCALILDVGSLYAESIAERERAFQIGGWTNSIVEQARTYRNWKGDLGLALKTLELTAPSESSDSKARHRYWRNRAIYLQARGDYAGALEALGHLDAESLPEQFYYYTKSFLVASVQEAMGHRDAALQGYAQALPQLESYRDANPGILRAHTSLALLYAALGREADARAEANQCLALVPPAENPYIASRTGLRIIAQIDARFGQVEQALTLVRSQIAAGFWKRYDLLLDADWTQLRTDPRFVRLAQDAAL